MKIMFCGASSGVTGSCHLIRTEKHNLLMDCGQFQGGKAQEALNYEPFPFEPSEIEAMILSHAHIDHCGRIPLPISFKLISPFAGSFRSKKSNMLSLAAIPFIAI